MSVRLSRHLVSLAAGLAYETACVAIDLLTCVVVGHDWAWRKTTMGEFPSCQRCGERHDR